MPTRRESFTEHDGYLRLREAIVRGELASNQRLVEAEISRAFDMPRGAVRSALVRLEQDHLVEREPHRGARVRHISEEEAVEILQARAALEGLAARHAALHTTRAQADELKGILAAQAAALAREDLLGASDVNAQLHAAIIRLSGHLTTQRLIAALNSQTVRFQFRTMLSPGRPSQSLREHTAIVEAVAAGDPEQAERAMRRHLDHVAAALGTAGGGGRPRARTRERGAPAA
jgi:DNA-binding GntR family transcriptional regulator